MCVVSIVAYQNLCRPQEIGFLTHVGLSAHARLSQRLNRKFGRTDDTTQDSEETATAFTVS